MLVRAQHPERKGAGVTLNPPDALSSVRRQDGRGVGAVDAELTHDRDGIDLAHALHPAMLGSF